MNYHTIQYKPQPADYQTVIFYTEETVRFMEFVVFFLLELHEKMQMTGRVPDVESESFLKKNVESGA